MIVRFAPLSALTLGCLIACGGGSEETAPLPTPTRDGSSVSIQPTPDYSCLPTELQALASAESEVEVLAVNDDSVTLRAAAQQVEADVTSLRFEMRFSQDGQSYALGDLPVQAGAKGVPGQVLCSSGGGVLIMQVSESTYCREQGREWTETITELISSEGLADPCSPASS